MMTEETLLLKKLQMLSPGDFDAPGMYGVSNPQHKLMLRQAKLNKQMLKDLML